jgi:hypothetical protein
MTHIFIHSNTLWVSLIRKTLWLSEPARYLFPAKTIGYSQFSLFILIFTLRFVSLLFYGLLFGLRGNAPMISLGGNSLYDDVNVIYIMNGSWLCNELASLTFDYENAMMITIGILYYDDK